MSRVEVVFYSSFTKKGNYRRSGNDSCAVTTAGHRLSLKGVLQLVLNRFALYRQSNVCFLVDFTKKLAEKIHSTGDHENCDIQKLKTQWKSFRMARRRCLN